MTYKYWLSNVIPTFLVDSTVLVLCLLPTIIYKDLRWLTTLLPLRLIWITYALRRTK